MLVADGAVSASDGALDVAEGGVDPLESRVQGGLATGSSDDRLVDAAGVADPVGGGAFLVPDRLAGISEVVRVPHGDCANAVGAATAQISGDTDQVSRALSRADAIAAAEAQAIARATKAGADPATITVIEVEDMPLAYLPGNALRVRVRVAGEMVGGE